MYRMEIICGKKRSILLDVFDDVEITARKDMPHLGIKKGDTFKAVVKLYGGKIVYIKRLEDGKILKNEIDKILNG